MASDVALLKTCVETLDNWREFQANVDAQTLLTAILRDPSKREVACAEIKGFHATVAEHTMVAVPEFHKHCPSSQWFDDPQCSWLHSFYTRLFQHIHRT